MDRNTKIGILALVGIGAYLLSTSSQAANATGYGDDGTPDDPQPPPQPPVSDTFNAGAMDAWAVDALEPSAEGLAFIKLREGLSLTKYTLGDGGVTIGYGHYEPMSRASLVPDQITQAQADAYFDSDIQTRGVDLVRKYVYVPLTQGQFDAMLSLAFNLSPSSFKAVADSVNNGMGLDPVVYNYIRAGTNLEGGLRARRDLEVALFENGTYA